jgi:hypothetical protein
MLEQTARPALATRALARATMSTARTAPVATYMATVSVPEDGGLLQHGRCMRHWL